MNIVYQYKHLNKFNTTPIINIWNKIVSIRQEVENRYDEFRLNNSSFIRNPYNITKFYLTLDVTNIKYNNIMNSLELDYDVLTLEINGEEFLIWDVTITNYMITNELDKLLLNVELISNTSSLIRGRTNGR